MDLSLKINSSNSSNGVGVIEKEHMFDKVVTPSDVGKLNRLVIPKQHAEKYFPLDGWTAKLDNKGLILNFEDPNGKPWRFRYSYWNSSQSYVMTRGWSRFVKDNKLHAGDVVSFLRALPTASVNQRLFIDSHPRPVCFTLPPPTHRRLIPSMQEGSSTGVSNKAGSGCTGAKRLRLFGVNMECAITVDIGDAEDQECLSNKRTKQPLSFNWDLL